MSASTARTRRLAMLPPLHLPQPTQKAKWKGQPWTARAGWAKLMFILDSHRRIVVEDIWDTLHYVQQSGEGTAIQIIGGSGAGKTRLSLFLEALVNHHYARTDEERVIRPVISYKIPEACSPIEWCLSLLEALGDQAPRRREPRSMVKQTAHLLRACDVRLVVTDNLQDVTTKLGVRGVEQLGAQMRELIDASSCLWVFLGTEQSRHVIDSENQFIKRAPYREELSYFSVLTGEDQLCFAQALDEVDEWLPLAELNSQLLASLRPLIFVATAGIWDRLVRLFSRACFQACVEGREHLLAEDFFEAFAMTFGPGQVNPFGKDFKMRLLQNPGEPYAILGAIAGLGPENQKPATKPRARRKRVN